MPQDEQLQLPNLTKAFPENQWPFKICNQSGFVNTMINQWVLLAWKLITSYPASVIFRHFLLLLFVLHLSLHTESCLCLWKSRVKQNWPRVLPRDFGVENNLSSLLTLTLLRRLCISVQSYLWTAPCCESNCAFLNKVVNHKLDS